MKVVLLGLDSSTQSTVDFLRSHNHSVFFVSKSEMLNSISDATRIDEDCLFKNAYDFDFAIRSKSVEAQNPNVIMLRDIIPVYNPISFFLDQFKCQVIFVIGGNTIIRPLERFLNSHGLTAYKWMENHDAWLEVEGLSDKGIIIAQISPEDLIDMNFMPKVMLIDSYPKGGARKSVDDYIRCQCLFSLMKKREFNVVGHICDEMQTLRSEFPDNIILFSTKNHKSDFFIDKLDLVDNRCLPKRKKSRQLRSVGLQPKVDQRVHFARDTF